MKTVIALQLLATTTQAAVKDTTGWSTASTTRNWDCSGGACGCGYKSDKNTQDHPCPSISLFTAPAGNKYGAALYGTAATDPDSTLQPIGWGESGCGVCYELVGMSAPTNYKLKNTMGTTLGGTAREAEEQVTIIVRGNNSSIPPNQEGCKGIPDCEHTQHFSINAAGYSTTKQTFCANMADEEPALDGYQTCSGWYVNGHEGRAEECSYATDQADTFLESEGCSALNNDLLREGCEHMRDLAWDNFDVHYQIIDCPDELMDFRCWGYDQTSLGALWTTDEPGLPPATVPTTLDSTRTQSGWWDMAYTQEKYTCEARPGGSSLAQIKTSTKHDFTSADM